MNALPRPSRQLLLLLLGSLVVFLLSHFTTVGTKNGDFTHTLLVSQAILEHGTVRLDAYQRNKDPNIDRYPEYLFDWRYPQFLASEQSLQQRKIEHLEKWLPKYAPGDTLRYDSPEALFWG